MTTASALHIKQTEAFINEAPVDIVIHRRSKEDTPSGGWRWVDEPDLAPQTVRKVGSYISGATSREVSRTTTDGKVVVPTNIVIGLPDWDVQIGDTFDIDGNSHEVVWISTLPPWRKAAEVYAHA